MKSDLIQKSVRLPSSLIEEIEKQKGANFSEKLIGILDESFNGDERRKKAIKQETEYLAGVKLRIDKYFDLLSKTRQASWKYEQLLKQLQEDIDRLQVSSP